MFRTSVYLPKPLHYRLHKAASEVRTSVSRLLIDIVDREMAHCDLAKLDHVYAVLDQLIGAGPKGIKNLSTTIDDVLYGS